MNSDMAVISNGDLRTCIGNAHGLLKVQWTYDVSEDISVRWLHVFDENDTTGLLSLQTYKEGFKVADNLIEDDIHV